MMKKKSLWAVLSCVAVIGLMAGCSDDDAVCGNGVAEGGEDCDLLDLKGATCDDVVDDTSGTLLCTDQCTYNVTDCTDIGDCGNGIEEWGETCDCGADPMNLPPNCTDVNGSANANCDIDCERIDLCGDGVRSGLEECDCGNPSMILSPGDGCAVYNGELNATCDDSCGEIVVCEFDLYDECFPLQGDPPYGCCEDDYGVQLDCKTSLFSSMDNMCARSCTTADECPWNNMCFGTVNPTYDLCFYSQCGPGDAVEAEIFGACQAQGANPGVCIPFGRYSDTHDAYGFCMEPGNIAHWDPCPTSNADPPVWLLGTDRDDDGGAADKMCDTGICLATQGAVEGVCAAFCNWHEEYDHIFYGAAASTLACPGTSNCWAEATISQDDAGGQYQDYGFRTGDLGYCRETAANDPTMGMTTCSLVTSELLSNTSVTCADVGFTDGRCLLVRYTSEYTDGNGNPVAGEEVTHGSLIGACADGTATTAGLVVWDTCDSANDMCPDGSNCMPDDVFGAGTGTERCVPYCDTNHHDGTIATCQDVGIPVATPDGTPVCTSLSYTYAHATLPGGPADPDKTRLGYCALPLP